MSPSAVDRVFVSVDRLNDTETLAAAVGAAMSNTTSKTTSGGVRCMVSL
jgi:hypothetical protein